jgi:hypothetical protein
MVKVKHAAALLALVLVTACAAWQPAQTFEQKLAYAYSVHTAVLNTAATGVSLGELKAEDGQMVLRLADESRVLLDASRAAMGAGDVTTAEGQLALATQILVQLQMYLRAHNER